jgi:hypothetical protein
VGTPPLPDSDCSPAGVFPFSQMPVDLRSEAGWMTRWTKSARHGVGWKEPAAFASCLSLASRSEDRVPQSRRHTGFVEREHVDACMRDVDFARARLRSARDSASSGWSKHALHADLLAALEGHAAAITRIGAPVPRKLRTELELYRRLRNHA